MERAAPLFAHRRMPCSSLKTEKPRTCRLDIAAFSESGTPTTRTRYCGVSANGKRRTEELEKTFPWHTILFGTGMAWA
jgi:hypothetical protein